MPRDLADIFRDILAYSVPSGRHVVLFIVAVSYGGLDAK